VFIVLVQDLIELISRAAAAPNPLAADAAARYQYLRVVVSIADEIRDFLPQRPVWMRGQNPAVSGIPVALLVARVPDTSSHVEPGGDADQDDDRSSAAASADRGGAPVDHH